MRVRVDSAEGGEVTHNGTVDAHSLLNAIGQACLRFNVRTEAIVYLAVEALDSE